MEFGIAQGWMVDKSGHSPIQNGVHKNESKIHEFKKDF